MECHATGRGCATCARCRVRSRSGPSVTHAVVVARRWSATAVGIDGDRNVSKFVPGRMSGEPRVHSLLHAHTIRNRGTVGDRTRHPRAVARLDDPAAARIGEEERREVRLVVCGSPDPPCPYRSTSPAVNSRASSAVRARSSTSAHDVHPEECRRQVAGRLDRPDLLVADRDTVLVDAVLASPQPGRP